MLDAPRPRAPGRPRKPAAPQILEATAAILAESGYPAFTIDMVASRAGLGRATIYRRWPTKLLLVTELLRSMAANFVVPDTGSLRSDLIVLVNPSKGALTPTERILATMIAEAFNNNELAVVLRTEYITHTRNYVAGVFTRAMDRGEVNSRAEVGLLVNAVWGFLWYRRFIARLRIDVAEAEQFVDTLILGLKAR